MDQGLDSRKHRHSAYRVLEVTASGADALGYASAIPVDDDRDFLEASPCACDDPDIPPVHDIREPERDSYYGLVAVADEAGRWTRNTFNGIPHVYNSRVAWGLLELHHADPRPDYVRVARANLDWAVSKQTNGWFDECQGSSRVNRSASWCLRAILRPSLER